MIIPTNIKVGLLTLAVDLALSDDQTRYFKGLDKSQVIYDYIQSRWGDDALNAFDKEVCEMVLDATEGY